MDDRDIRFEFIKRNLKFFKKDKGIFVNEFSICRRRVVDLAFFDFDKNVSFGFEIKSSNDNLNRIEGQLKVYTQYFNIVYIICATNHISKLKEVLLSKSFGKNVGIIEVDEELNFKEIITRKLYILRVFSIYLLEI